MEILLIIIAIVVSMGFGYSIGYGACLQDATKLLEKLFGIELRDKEEDGECS